MIEILAWVAIVYVMWRTVRKVRARIGTTSRPQPCLRCDGRGSIPYPWRPCPQCRADDIDWRLARYR